MHPGELPVGMTVCNVTAEGRGLNRSMGKIVMAPPFDPDTGQQHLGSRSPETYAATSGGELGQLASEHGFPVSH